MPGLARSFVALTLIAAASAFPGMIPDVQASPVETSDARAATCTGISAGSDARHVYTVMPPLQFAVDQRLRKNVDFWIDIYSKYTSRQGLIHDAKYIDHVYEVIDLDRASRGTRDAKSHWKKVLLSLHRKQKDPQALATLTEEERKVYELFQDVNEPNKFLNAAHRKRLRFQLGQKDVFLDGLKQSGRYLGEMERIFAEQGMPVELTRLPFVESSFNVRARSKVGASGIWQFMRSTGRLYLKINDAVDERNDPIRATEAAAKLLRGNYESLGRWPLAVTAYNHGRKGMMRAVRQVGSEEIEDLVGNYRGRTFGFASSNFFMELLAAIEVERDAEKYFGKVERHRPIASIEAPLPHSISLPQLVRLMKLDFAKLRVLNPALSDGAYTGKSLIPAGYRLRLPYDGKIHKEAALKVFFAGYEEIPARYKLQGNQQGQRIRKYAKRARK